MNKKAIVTGASSGIGHETARRFATDGWTVFAVARRADALASLRDEIGNAILPHAVDLTGPDAPEQCIAAAVEQMGTGSPRQQRGCDSGQIINVGSVAAHLPMDPTEYSQD